MNKESIDFLRKACSRQAMLIKRLGSALEGLAYYALYDNKTELCGFDAEAGTKNFEPAANALRAYNEWKNKP